MANSNELFDFHPTREELGELAQLWATARLDRLVNMYYTGVVGSYDTGLCTRAAERLEYIAEVLGQDSVEAIVAQVKDDFRQRMGRDWESFTKGRPEEYDAVSLDWRLHIGKIANERVAEYVAQEAITVFWQLHKLDLKAALVAAADAVGAGRATAAPCEHDWQVSDLGAKLGAMQCARCRAFNFPTEREPMDLPPEGEKLTEEQFFERVRKIKEANRRLQGDVE